MKKSSLFILVLLCANGFSQQLPMKITQYDSTLAKTIGADDYGMKQYVMAFLKRGPVKVTDSTQRANIFAGHMKNIGRMADEGSLVVAGPFMDNGELRGIYIFNVTTVEEAKKLTETDPAIQAGTLEMELHPWFGSAALMEVTRIHHTLEKRSFTK